MLTACVFSCTRKQLHIIWGWHFGYTRKNTCRVYCLIYRASFSSKWRMNTFSSPPLYTTM
jgi:hypothetical protein